MELLNLLVEKIKENKLNPNIHPPEEIDRIAKNILEFGFYHPVIVDDNYTLLAGHARLQAAKLVNLAQIPAYMMHNLTDTQKNVLLISDNKLGKMSYFDPDKLRGLLSDIQLSNFDTEITGFTTEEIEDLCADIDIVDGDDETEGDPVAELNAQGAGAAPDDLANIKFSVPKESKNELLLYLTGKKRPGPEKLGREILRVVNTLIATNDQK